MTQYLKGDLQEVLKQAPFWVRATAAEQIQNQVNLGNSKQYTAVVDGSKDKPVDQADRKVQVYFVTALLARNLEKVRRVLEMVIRRSTKTHTGQLAGGWVWHLQRGGKSGGIQLLGVAVPPNLELRPGDALILAPSAPYAWFASYYATRRGSTRKFTVAFARRAQKKFGGRISRARTPPRGFGFMAVAARSIRPELKRIGVSVWPRFTTELAPAGTRARYGVPILVLTISKSRRQEE